MIDRGEGVRPVSTEYRGGAWLAGKDDRVTWIFERGMEFGSSLKWWGSHGARKSCHEGLDFRRYQDGDGKVHSLTASTKIPALFAGHVAAVFDDFLAKTIVLEHDYFIEPGRKLLTIYAHMNPFSEMILCRPVAAGEMLGSPAPPPASPVPLHLHLSVGHLPAGKASSLRNWSMLNQAQFGFLDPLLFLEIFYRFLTEM